MHRSDSTNDIREKPPRYPILLSGLICPGIGQMVQRRWGWGLFFAVSFIAGLAGFLICTVSIIIKFYALALGGEGYQDPEVNGNPAVIWFAVAIVVYFINLADVFLAYQRDVRQRTEERLADVIG